MKKILMFFASAVALAPVNARADLVVTSTATAEISNAYFCLPRGGVSPSRTHKETL